MPTPAPRVSIGMPLYNAERYLVPALDSLLRQTHDEFELVISDNASTDATAEICQDFAAGDPRIRYVREEENRGAMWNFNRVFELARGEYFKWAAGDDVVQPTFLERTVEALDRNPGVVWCHSQTLHLDDTGAVIPPEADPHIPEGKRFHSMHHTDHGYTRRDAPQVCDRFAAVVLGTTWCSDSFGLIRSESLRRTQMYLPCYGSEKVLMAELALLGQYREIPEILFHERIHPAASGNLATVRQQSMFSGGGTARKFSSTRFQLLAGYRRAISRAYLSRADRFGCYRVLARYVCQVQKWRRILTGALSGSGMGDREAHQSRAGNADSSSTAISGTARVPAAANADGPN